MTHEPIVDLKLAEELGLTKEEYERILNVLGRTPSYTELGIFSVMWSEHCSYKNSILQLKTLPRSGGRLMVEAGEENAGLVDIGDGLAVAFKIESHNHPSAVEPYQGAATGVGGILRDIFTMGARPVAALNSLRFGRIDDEAEESVGNRSRFLFKNVVRGVGDYGNCFGVPTVSGEVYFEECYQDNPLVNAMAVGIVRHGETASATAGGVGNPVFIVGSSTGKDGIHGATFASEEISEDSEAKRPSVQVGDPFTEKLLLEATLEVIGSGALVGIQDMGAAGITCSSSEMSAKGRCGMRLDLDKVPLRDKDMSAYEIMLSESQERMLLVAHRGKERVVRDIFEKWDLNCVEIGEVIGEDRILVFYKGRCEADIPADILVLGGGAPVYRREMRSPYYLKETSAFDVNGVLEPRDLNEVLLRLLASPNITSKRWVYEQYDTQVRTNTLLMPGGDASVIRIKGTDKALSMKTDCNGRFAFLNPYFGGMIAVCESARNVVCTGAEPLAITNCLNFGNPYDAEMYFQFSECVRGMGDACRFLGTPVTGGNVSFYNLSREYAVFPTPTIGMVGLIEDAGKMMTSYFKDEGDDVFIVGEDLFEVGGSEYLSRVHGLIKGDAPQVFLEREKRLHDFVLRVIREGLIKSAHDVSDGGVAVGLAECCVMGRERRLGCSVSLGGEVRKDFMLFSESQSRVIISADRRFRDEIFDCARGCGQFIDLIGCTGGDFLRIEGCVDVGLDVVYDRYFNSIHRIMER